MSIRDEIVRQRLVWSRLNDFFDDDPTGWVEFVFTDSPREMAEAEVKDEDEDEDIEVQS